MAVVTIDRPEKANALDPSTLRQLASAWREIADDDEVRCAILTGAGDRVFCAGMDMAETTEAMWQEALRAYGEAHRRLVAALDRSPPERAAQRFGAERDPAAGSGVTYAVMLHGLAQHDAYHMGQISLLKKTVRGASGHCSV